MFLKVGPPDVSQVLYAALCMGTSSPAAPVQHSGGLYYSFQQSADLFAEAFHLAYHLSFADTQQHVRCASGVITCVVEREAAVLSKHTAACTFRKGPAPSNQPTLDKGMSLLFPIRNPAQAPTFPSTQSRVHFCRVLASSRRISGCCSSTNRHLSRSCS